ncbi:MAG: aminopeptidase P family protein [Deltaproteobacteria bacterium]|nr:aminopeptidase P family protein [Deltaproteobacteria bacterium]
MNSPKRLAKFWKLIGKNADAMLVTSPENVRYLCGFSGTEGTLLITRAQGFFLTDGRYTTQARKEVRGFPVVTFKKKWERIGSLAAQIKITRLGYEARHVSVAMLQDIEKHADKCELAPVSAVLDSLRACKNTAEISLLKKAARIAADSLAQVLPLIKPGLREVELAAELDYRMRCNGGQGSAFPTIVASGERSALPHAAPTDKKIRAGDLLTIDYGTLYEGYCSDETCTFVVGKAGVRQKKLYELVRQAHDRAIAALAAGCAARDIDAAARDYLKKNGVGKYFTHGTGHGLGMCVHEFPSVTTASDAVLARGMVVTIEPGIYIPGWGGIRIEDTLAVCKDGCKYITCTGKDLTVLG